MMTEEEKKQKKKEWHRRSYLKHREERLEHQRKYYREHTEQYKKRRAAYYQSHRETALICCARYRFRHDGKGNVEERMRLYIEKTRAWLAREATQAPRKAKAQKKEPTTRTQPHGKKPLTEIFKDPRAAEHFKWVQQRHKR